MPIGSYIDALNQSPKNLAHFLRYLDKNEELYNNYHQVKHGLKKFKCLNFFSFQWKKEFYIEEDPWLCKLCFSLNSVTNHFAFPPSQVTTMARIIHRKWNWLELETVNVYTFRQRWRAIQLKANGSKHTLQYKAYRLQKLKLQQHRLVLV